MGTTFYSCGCSITRSMFNNKIMDFRLCVWHNYIYDEDKTIRQIVEDRINIKDMNLCYCMCHWYDDIMIQKCIKCGHISSEGNKVLGGWKLNKT